MIDHMVRLAGGDTARIVVIPVASAEPVETAEYQTKQFRDHGVERATYILPMKEHADHDTLVAAIRTATGVFFSGGDQRRLTDILLGTELLGEIMALYQRGGLVAGTSAGAAVMGEIMITGDELKYPDAEDAFATIEADNIVTTEGFGFMPSVIIDQHFIARKRHNRLISLVLQQSGLIGIGIDESTAIVVRPDETFQVIGESNVVVYDAREARTTKRASDQRLEGIGITMHVLLPGSMFDLKTMMVME
jgi:cyanophycinase